MRAQSVNGVDGVDGMDDMGAIGDVDNTSNEAKVAAKKCDWMEVVYKNEHEYRLLQT